MQRVKVTSPAFPAWEANGSPWVSADVERGGDLFGDVYTPPIGSWVRIKLLNGDSDAIRWSGSARSEENRPPEEFADPEVNGTKSPGGILITINDGEKSYSVEVPEGAKVFLSGEGKVYTTGDTHLNEGVIPIAIGGPTVVCPVTGKEIPSSTCCFVKE